MITSGELRIGNFAYFDHIKSRITAIDLELNRTTNETVANNHYQFVELSSGRVTGVPIDREFLLCSNFKKEGDLSGTIEKWSIEDSNFMIYFNGEYAGLITSLPNSVPVYYIHQLQNLYYALIGKELLIAKTPQLEVGVC